MREWPRRCAVGAVLALLGACNSGPSPEELAQIQREEQAWRQEYELSKQRGAMGRQRTAQAVSQLQATLSALKAALPPASSFTEDRICPARVDLAGRLPVVELADVDFILAGRGAVEARRAAAGRDIRFISDAELPRLENWFTLGDVQAASFDPAPYEALARSTVLVLFTPLRREPPVRGDTLRAADIDGWLVVMDVAAKQPLCHVRVQSSNSPTVRSTMTVNLDTGEVRAPGPDLLLDAGNVWRAAARAALGRIAPSATLYGDF